MSQWLTLSRAARLIGVPRGELQREIREGRLPANDGMVSTAGLLALYPRLSLEESGAFERVARVKEEAFGRRVLERALPGREVLAQRLFEQSQELADARRHLSRYHDLVVALHQRIDASAQATEAPATLADLRSFLERGLADVLATETVDPLAIMDDMLKVVSSHVTVRPSGREFFVEGRDTLLQAGLKAGLKLNYGCGNGTCGLCKARVVAGQVTKVAPHDYPLSDAERLQGHVLLCVHGAASSEIVLESLEAAGPGDIPEQQIAVRVRSVKPLGVDTLHVHLQTPRTMRLRFLAGQSATLSAAAGGREAHGTYAIASCPCDERNLHFHVPRADTDPFAALLFDGALTVNATVNLSGPVGDFVFWESERRLAFLACDTGFAPIKSLIEHAMAVDAAESIALGWLATRVDGHYLANQCRAWAEAFDQFRYVPVSDPDPAAGASALVATMEAVRPLAACDVYVAGPAPFVAAATAALAAAGVPAGQTYAAIA
ncbi:MAG: 2Fe-2S iron-sulfur cluster binding domain-containing protein [Betaproteobacteria bacterium]|nr:2Fe-2S iron-sulfur cluster binding domain-containing protein [Betaproteobacteria bacterium]